MHLNIAGNKRLETYEECLQHLRKFKDDARMAVAVERILERNNFISLYTERSSQIEFLRANGFLYPVGNLLAAYRARLSEIESTRLPLGWVIESTKK